MIRRNPELYELYRPQRLEDLVGAGSRELVGYIKSRLRDPHYDRDAIMIVGPSGSGKTTSARIIGHYLAQGDMDYMEVEGAVAGNIDTVRNDIIPWLRTYPWSGGWKVLVIDEAQRLSDVAKDAFLNIVENLPERHMVIFTATPDFTGGVPFQPALVSRFKLFQFKEPTEADVRAVLVRIAAGQGWNPPFDDVVRVIYAAAEGNLRRAIQLYEVYHHTGTIQGQPVTAAIAPGGVADVAGELNATLEQYQRAYIAARDRMTDEQKVMFLGFAKERVAQMNVAMQMPEQMAWRTLESILLELRQMLSFLEGS